MTSASMQQQNLPEPSSSQKTRLRQFADNGWLDGKKSSNVPPVGALPPLAPQIPGQQSAVPDTQWQRQVQGGVGLPAVANDFSRLPLSEGPLAPLLPHVGAAW